jgi:hypothetical protein
MSGIRRRATPVFIAGLSLAASLILSGCSVTAPGNGVYGAAATPSANATDDAAQGPAELPATFPSDFPLIERDLVVSYDLGTGWAVWVKSDHPGADFEAASNLLTAAGYVNDQSVTNDTGSFGSFSKGALQVQLTAGDDAQYGNTVAYTIYRTE